MSASAEKVKKIINQIENRNQNHTADRGRKKTVDEVVDIFLKDASVRPNTTVHKQGWFNMDEFRHWKEQMNQTYQISYNREIICYRRHMRKVIILAKRVIRKMCRSTIQPIVEEQSTFNANTTAAMNHVYNNESVTEELIETMQQQLENVKNDVELYKSQILDEVEKKYDVIEKKYETYQSLVSGEIEKKYAACQVEMERRHTQEEMKLFRNARLQGCKKEEEKEPDRLQDHMAAPIAESNVYDGIDYFDFENHFRGSRKEIKDAESIYIPYFKDKKSVVDLGCGRGEFLELLQENGIPCIGVDNYAEFVDYCKAKALHVIYGDAVNYLSTQEDNSIGGVFAAQLIEHLDNGQLLSLCRLAYKKLTNDGCLIMETPNPMCLSIYMNAFYIDPSHQKPVHPKTMEYILKREGFREVEIVFPEKSKSGYRLPLLHCTASDNLDDFNNGINLLSDILFSSEDYAVIAKK